MHIAFLPNCVIAMLLLWRMLLTVTRATMVVTLGITPSTNCEQSNVRHPCWLQQGAEGAPVSPSLAIIQRWVTLQSLTAVHKLGLLVGVSTIQTAHRR